MFSITFKSSVKSRVENLQRVLAWLGGIGKTRAVVWYRSNLSLFETDKLKCRQDKRERDELQRKRQKEEKEKQTEKK